METKVCIRCHEEKLTDEFYRNSKSKDGRNNTCRTCRLQQVKSYQLEHAEEIKERQDNYRRDNKLSVLNAYGGKCSCPGCEENRPEFLTIDHIGGGGNKHRKEAGIHGGTSFYTWLKQRGFPQDKFRLLCYNCNCATGRVGYCPHQLEKEKKVEMELKVGYVVMLNSGGPNMTIDGFSGEDIVYCTWFDGNTVEKDAFPRMTLTLVEGE